MANGDSDRDASQSHSKRPPLSQHDSDSQYSDHSQQQGHHAVREHRPRATKHVVGGGSRLHARVPSSKALHKSHSSTSSAKLTKRQASPSPDRIFAAASTTSGNGHRRATSEVSISHDPSGTNLKKNASHTSLKRNRSKVEVGKKSKSTTSLKSAASNGPVNKHIKTVNQVHFNLGDDEEDDDEGEWVDASTSASPLLSRRTSVVSGNQSAPNSRPPTAQEHRRSYEGQEDRPQNDGAHSPDQHASKRKQYLTSRLLERTSAQQAPPMMSAENVQVRNVSSRHHSPDSRHSGSTLSGTPQLQSHMRPGSSGKAELTSRFVHQSSGSGSGALGSFTAATSGGALARAANGRIEVLATTQAPRRPKSTNNLAQVQQEVILAQVQSGYDEDEPDSQGGGIVGVTRSRPKRNTPYVAPQLEMNRTQQKLNLQRASSTLEQTVPHPAIGMGLGGLPVAATGSSYGARDAVLPKVLEKTGMEYLVVKRYQNPIGRSLHRLQQLPGADKHRRIPKPGTHSRTQSRAGSEYGALGLRSGPVMNLQMREQREGRDTSSTSSRDSHREPGVVGLIGGRIDRDRRPGSRRGYSGLGINGGGVNGGQGGDEDPNGRMDGDRTVTRLSGSSLVDVSEDASTVATLRNLWDKNMDLSASQE